eukprot:1153269-Pelagomonas_calceolata.AAC.2
MENEQPCFKGQARKVGRGHSEVSASLARTLNTFDAFSTPACSGLMICPISSAFLFAQFGVLPKDRIG